MKYSATPFDIAAASCRFWWLAAEANSVMTMRMMGMAGGWNVTKGEDTRMWHEKPVAFQKSAEAATRALLSGKPPHKVAEAAMRPLDKAVSANRKRLTKRGPRNQFHSPSLREG